MCNSHYWTAAYFPQLHPIEVDSAEEERPQFEGQIKVKQEIFRWKNIKGRGAGGKRGIEGECNRNGTGDGTEDQFTCIHFIYHYIYFIYHYIHFIQVPDNITSLFDYNNVTDCSENYIL